MAAPPPSPPPREVDRLIAALASSDTLRRDAAVARLRVIGTRAFSRLAACIDSDAAPGARAAALAALEGGDAPRAVEVALGALESSDVEVVVAALGVLRGWVARETGTRLLEAVSAIAVDSARDARVRVAALDALADLPEPLTRPIRAQAPPPESAGPPLDDPAAAGDWVEAYGATVTLSRLHDLIKTLREQEEVESAPRRRSQWQRVRGTAHLALAARGSRLALYDARETIAGARGPLPAGFLDAVARVGDSSCLEPLARAWSAAPQDASWQDRLRETAQHIVRRSRLSPRGTALRRVRANWEGFL